MHRLIFLVVLFILPSAPGITQDSTIAKADSLFDQKSFSEAAHLYQQIATEYRDKLRAEKGRYRHYYVLYRIAVSHQRAGNSEYYMYYRRFINEYNRSLEFYKEKHDLPVYYLLADAYYQLGDFSVASEYYWNVLEKVDSLPDQYRFTYAVSVMCAGYYGRAIQFFQNIENKQAFEPQYSAYLQKCIDSSKPRFTSELAWGDTIELRIMYDGCYGDDSYRYHFIKRPFGYQAILYEDKHQSVGWEDGEPWKIRKDTVLSPDVFAYVVALEKTLRDFYPDYGSFSSMTGYYLIKTGSKQFIFCDYGQLMGYVNDFIELFR